MNVAGKEFYELLDIFERTFAKTNYGLRPDLGREADKELWKKSIIYNHAPTNNAFLAFRSGYELGKAI